MLCSNCGKNEANVRYTRIINGEKTEFALCEDCAKKMGLEDIDFNIPTNFLSDFFEDDNLLPSFAKIENERCPKCGLTYDDFVNNGKFGCAECYDTFSNKLDSILKNLHGTSKHIGRKPKNIVKAIDTQSTKKEAKNDDDVVTVTWMTSRPVDGEIDQVMHEIADQYSKEKGGKWKIEFETTADRPSYLQKLKTLIAGGNMPDIIDIDADPYCQELVDAGMLVDVKQFLKDNEGVTIPEIETYAGGTRAIVKTLEKNGYVEIIEKKIERDPLASKKIEKTENLKLTLEQQMAFDEISEKMEQQQYERFLIYGVTGSGKTEIYLQLIEKAMEQNKTSIVLVPEISLTPQMIDRFISRFGKDEIAVLHSKLSLGERYDEWNRIKEGKAKIVIGARSAIFAPLNNIGIIIIDEEHDSSYKSESVPKYDAKEIAKKIAKENNCPLVLGSATPDLTTYYKARQGKITLLALTKRANNSKLPNVELAFSCSVEISL